MTTVPNQIFRGYDIRGLVGTELNKDTISLLGKGYATWLAQRRIYDCVVGNDCRLSSEEFKNVIVRELTSAGITVYDIGLTLTPIAYFAQYYFRTRGMVMITASHNPKEYNGLKLATGYSETMVTDDIKQFKQIINDQKFIHSSNKGKHIQEDIKQAYFKDILGYLDRELDATVVIDSCSATAGLYLPELLRQAGCRVIEQNSTPDGNFPVGTPDPTSRAVEMRLSNRVKQESADVGFSFDGDGDRMGVVDEKGQTIWDDALCSLYAEDILEFIPKSKIVYNVLCSKQVGEVIEAAGGSGIICKSGHSFMTAKIREEKAIFGGELSGHFYFVDNFYGHDDSAMAALRLLLYLRRKKKTLSQMIEALPHYYSSPEIKLGCSDISKFEIVDGVITDTLKLKFNEAHYLQIDGIRIDTDDEMVIIRASQNGPYLTVRFEAKTKEHYEHLRTFLRDVLHKIPEIDFTSGVNIEAL